MSNVAPGAGPGIPFVCDCDGNGTLEVGKYVAATSTVYVDLNNNGVWDGNAGGDLAFSFAPGAGPGTFLFANLGGTDAWEVIKYYASLGGIDLFQIDLNNNQAWNGAAGGDAAAVVAPAAGAGTPCAIDLDGDGVKVLCKTVAATSSIFVDANGNRAWNGNAGGDASGAFAPGGGVGTFVILQEPAP